VWEDLPVHIDDRHVQELSRLSSFALGVYAVDAMLPDSSNVTLEIAALDINGYVVLHLGALLNVIVLNAR
jgi:hypothetical protein